MVEHACKQIEKIAKLEQKQTDIEKQVDEIKEGLKWNTRYTITILVTIILTIAGYIISKK